MFIISIMVIILARYILSGNIFYMRTYVKVITLKTTTKSIESETIEILKLRNINIEKERNSFKDKNGKFQNVNPYSLPRQTPYSSLKVKRFRFIISNVNKKFYNTKQWKLITFIYEHILKTKLDDNYYYVSVFKKGSFYIDIPPYLRSSDTVDALITPTSIGMINTAIKHLLKDSDYIPAHHDTAINKKLIEHILAHGEVGEMLKVMKSFKNNLSLADSLTYRQTLKGWKMKILQRAKSMI